MYIKEGGNVFKDADGAIATTRINQTDVKPTAQWLKTKGVDGAIMQQAFQTAGIKMPDLKKIASDDPVMSLAQQINKDPAIKKQVIAYLNAVT